MTAPDEERPLQDPDAKTHSADDVRQGDIILRTRARRMIFIAGLAGMVLAALVLSFAA